jgi:hypothetical protein
MKIFFYLIHTQAGRALFLVFALALSRSRSEPYYACDFALIFDFILSRPLFSVREQDSQNRTARTGQPEQDSQNRTARTGQPKQDSQSRTARTGQPEQDSRNKTVGTRQPEKDSRNRTA